MQVNNSKAMEKILNDEKLHQQKEEDRLKKVEEKQLDKRTLFRLVSFCRS